MTKIKKDADLFSVLRHVIWDTYPYAVLKKVFFQAECGCLSEVTLDPCSLWIELTNPESELDLNIMESVVRYWADNHLQWSGCECCDNELHIDVRCFTPPETYKEDWIASQPVTCLIENSTLYAGQNAISKIITLVEKQTTDKSIKPIIVHMGHFTGIRQAYLVIVRKIDQYDDGHIGIYTKCGVLSLYPETPVTEKLIVEAIEIPSNVQVGIFPL
jgi:hypothetical protein